jgi:hypothetical protein
MAQQPDRAGDKFAARGAALPRAGSGERVWRARLDWFVPRVLFELDK